jgi:hypothetical protein
MHTVARDGADSQQFYVKIRSHKEVKVWREAMDLAMAIFALSKQFPPEEKWTL